jgi:hypothetical protein
MMGFAALNPSYELLRIEMSVPLVSTGKLRLNSCGWIDPPATSAIQEPLNDDQFSADHR